MEEHFFMNVPKTYCYVTYPSMEDARKAKEDLYLQCLILVCRNGKQFPEKFGNKLRVRFTSISAASMKRDNKSAKEENEPSEKRQKMEPKEVVPLESLFHKTKTRPVIFYKPLTESEVRKLGGADGQREAKHKKCYFCCNKQTTSISASRRGPSPRPQNRRQCSQQHRPCATP